MMIALTPTNILGIDKKYSYSEQGKPSPLFIFNKNAIDRSSNQLTRAFIEGNDIPYYASTRIARTLYE
jgi:hypothetical protein